MKSLNENVLFCSLVLRIDQKITNWIKHHRIKTGFIIAFIGATWYMGFYPWIFSKLTWKERLSKKLRRWILGEQNLPPPSINETYVKVS